MQDFYDKTKTNLVILPTRSRPDKTAEAVDLLQKNSTISDICVAIDNDQSDLYPRIEGVIYEVNERLRMNGTLNLVASKYVNKYETIFFLGDDHRTRTYAWDEKLYESIKSRGYGLSYGDDKLQGKGLATAVMMSTNIIKSLGFMAPPKLIHLYMDNFWMSLGHELNCIDYISDVIIEHMHFGAGKSQLDEQYAEVNSSVMYEKDKASYMEYMELNMKIDLEKIKKEIGI